MSRRNVLIVLGVIFSIPVIMNLWILDESLTYEEELSKYRLERDYFMRNSPQSPFENTSEFEGLNYFPINSKFKLTANFKPSDNINVISLSTSDGLSRRYREYGIVSFILDKEQHELTIYQSAEFGGPAEPLFLGFTDQTTGIETYGAGRYMDIEHDGSENIVLDFNKAYNPFCAYNMSYSCPIPPRVNQLNFKLLAGEKDYKK